MQVKEITISKQYQTSLGQTMSVSLTASVDTEEDLVRAAHKLNQLSDAKLHGLVKEVNSAPEPCRATKPTDAQWFKLRQLLMKKKGIKEDSEIFEFVMNNLETDNIEWISYAEIEMLIKQLEEEC